MWHPSTYVLSAQSSLLLFSVNYKKCLSLNWPTIRFDDVAPSVLFCFFFRIRLTVRLRCFHSAVVISRENSFLNTKKKNSKNVHELILFRKAHVYPEPVVKHNIIVWRAYHFATHWFCDVTLKYTIISGVPIVPPASFTGKIRLVLSCPPTIINTITVNNGKYRVFRVTPRWIKQIDEFIFFFFCVCKFSQCD